NDYRRVYSEVNGTDAPPPIVGGWTFCDEDPGRAEELGRRYIGAYWRSVVKHYELVGDHLTKMRGYEAYKEVQERVSTPGGIDARRAAVAAARRAVVTAGGEMPAPPLDQPLERQLHELATVHQSLRALTSTLELPEILRAVLDGIKTFTAAEGLSLLLYDRERDELVFSATETLQESALLGLPATGGPSAAGWAACTGESPL